MIEEKTAYELSKSYIQKYNNKLVKCTFCNKEMKQNIFHQHKKSKNHILKKENYILRKKIDDITEILNK